MEQTLGRLPGRAGWRGQPRARRPATADVVTNANDSLRTGWYPDESSITPQLVSGSSWGQLWSAPVDGQVYAQPLLDGNTLVVSTETDNVYGLDPATGNQQWSDDLAPNGPWNPADVGCSDLVPSRGSTSTPVIDTSTNTVYLTHKTYDDSHNAVWWMDALNVSNGQELPGWPVQLSGTADNDPSLTFHAKDQDQRPGLLSMNGVVYAGFGSICDNSPFDGWVFGVSASTGQSRRVGRRSRTATAAACGSPAWAHLRQPGSILIATGNGGSPSTPTPGSSLRPSCGECVIRLDVQPDGTLKPVDFFAPFDAAQLDEFDTDFGSGGVVGLPDQYFGTPSVPHLAIAVGKEGYVYLLNRDDLGGYDEGPGGGDNVVQRLGSYGAVFGRPGVWPGDGGYVYIPTSCSDRRRSARRLQVRRDRIGHAVPGAGGDLVRRVRIRLGVARDHVRRHQLGQRARVDHLGRRPTGRWRSATGLRPSAGERPARPGLERVDRKRHELQHPRRRRRPPLRRRARRSRARLRLAAHAAGGRIGAVLPEHDRRVEQRPADTHDHRQPKHHDHGPHLVGPQRVRPRDTVPVAAGDAEHG